MTSLVLSNLALTTSDKIEVFGIIASLVVSVVAVFISVVALRQNSKMIEESTRPYVVVYNDLVNGANTPIQFLIIKNYGQTAATINSFEITPKTDFTYSDDLFKHLDSQIIAPGQSYSTAFKLKDSSIKLTAHISYSSGKKTYEETFSISQKAISDHVHSKAVPKTDDEAHKIMAGCFQDYLRSRL